MDLFFIKTLEDCTNCCWDSWFWFFVPI